MQDNPSVLDGILDIESPAMPLVYAWEHNALAIAVTGLLVIALLATVAWPIRRHYFSAQGRARRRLAALQNHYNNWHEDNKQLDSRNAAFQIADILRTALNVPQISHRTALPETLGAHQARWQTFIERLSIARYAGREQATDDFAMLLADAQFWLRHWPRDCS